MITTVDPRTLRPTQEDVGDLLGEIISWESPTEVPIETLRDGLKAAGFKEELARDMLPRNAWLRAAKRMEEDRVIDKIEDAGGIMLFQFTKKYLADKQWDFRMETILTLEKATGKVSCTVWELEERAQRLIDEQMGKRSSADVTRIIQTICRKEADLFPIRRQGGVYFVPDRHSWVIGSLGTLLESIKGSLVRFPVPAGSETGRLNAAQIMQQELHTRIQDHMDLIAKYTEKVDDEVLCERSKAIVRLKGELESYEVILDHFADELRDHWVAANELLIQKIEEASAV